MPLSRICSASPSCITRIESPSITPTTLAGKIRCDSLACVEGYGKQEKNENERACGAQVLGISLWISLTPRSIIRSESHDCHIAYFLGIDSS